MPTAKVTVTTAVVVVVALLGFGLIIHMVSKAFAAQCPGDMTYNKDLKKCVPTCPAGEKYYLSLNACSKWPPGQTFNQGKCTVVACEDDQIVCGTQCISPLTATCVGDKPCPLQANCVHEYTDSDGKKQCCPNCVGKTKEGKDDCCKDGTHVGDDGTCSPPYVLVTDGTTLDPAGEQPTTVSCRKGSAQYNSLDDCQDALREVPCPQGFARSGTDPNSLQCYRYGFQLEWNPGPVQKRVPCQGPDYRSANDMGMFCPGPAVPPSKMYCTDDGTVVPNGAYFCNGDSLLWDQCTDPKGCVVEQGPGTKYGDYYHFSPDFPWNSVDFCSDPGYGNSPTKIPTP